MYKSYVKTMAMSLMLVVVMVMVMVAVLALPGLPNFIGHLTAVVALLLVLPAAAGACAGLIVLVRYRRGAAGR